MTQMTFQQTQKINKPKEPNLIFLYSSRGNVSKKMRAKRKEKRFSFQKKFKKLNLLCVVDTHKQFEEFFVNFLLKRNKPCSEII